MRNNLTKIFAVMAMSVMTLTAGAINIPQAAVGDYILIGDGSTNPKTTATGATLTKCQVDGSSATSYTVGSTGAQTQIDFALNATVAGDYLFSFMSGSDGYTAKLSLSLKNSSSEEIWSGTADIINTGAWALTTRHLFAVGNLSADSYTMTIKVTEQAQDGGDKSYAGNYGNFCFHTATQYPWPSSSALNMEHGTFVNANWNSDNVINNIRAIGASIDNLIVYNNTESFYKFCFNIAHLKQNSKVGITITDMATGNVEVDNQTLEITSTGDKMIRLPYALSTGFKKIRFDFTDNDLSSEDQYLYNFQTVTLPAIPSLPLYGTGYLDLSAGTFGRTASAKYDHDPQYESGNDNIGFNGDGGYAEYYVGNTNPADYYELHLGTNRYQEDATFSITITDVATDSEEVNQDFAVPSGSSYADLTCVLYNKITPGLKKIRIETHSSSSSYAFNYNHVCFRSIPALPIESALDLEHGTYNNANWNSDNVVNYIKAAGASIDDLYVNNVGEGFYKFCFTIEHLKQNSKVGITITDVKTGDVEIDNQTLEITGNGDKEIRLYKSLSVGLKKIRFDFTDNDSGNSDEHLFNFKTVTLPAVSYDALPLTGESVLDLSGLTSGNPRYQEENHNLGWIYHNGTASFYVNNTNPAAHYYLSAGIRTNVSDANLIITVTDVATGNAEINEETFDVAEGNSSYPIQTFALSDAITPGLKLITFKFTKDDETTSQWLYNINNISFTMLHYTREHPHMNLNTLCFPYQIDYYTGATFYTMLYKKVENAIVTDVYLQEHVGALEAGTPYFYVPDEGETELVCYYSGDREDTPQKVNGVQGAYDDDTPVPAGAYVTYNNIIRIVGDPSYVTLAEYRAYIDMSAVSGTPVAAAPGRRLLSIRNADAPAVTTGIENTSAKLDGSQKVLRNGQLFIIRDGKTYNAFGQTVK